MFLYSNIKFKKLVMCYPKYQVLVRHQMHFNYFYQMNLSNTFLSNLFTAIYFFTETPLNLESCPENSRTCLLMT